MPTICKHVHDIPNYQVYMGFQCLLCMPLQHFLNACLEAESLTHIFAEMAASTPLDATSVPSSFKDAQDAAIKKNLAILSGRKGWGAIRDAFSIVSSFSSEHWRGLKMSRPMMFSLACGVLQLMAEAYMRVVFPYEVEPKYQILQSAATDVFDEEHIARICQTIQVKQTRCQGCVDRFSDTWCLQKTVLY